MSKENKKSQSEKHQRHTDILHEEEFEDIRFQEDEGSVEHKTKEKAVEDGDDFYHTSGDVFYEDSYEDSYDDSDEEEPDEEVTQRKKAEKKESKDTLYSEDTAEEGEAEVLDSVRNNRKNGRRKKRGMKSAGAKPWIIAGSIVGVLLVIYLGVSAYFIGHFYVNTTINGKDFSGATAEAVEAYFKDQVEGYELTLIEQGNQSDTIQGSDISLEYRESTEVEDALKKQNPLLWVKAFFSKTATDVTVSVEYDEAALAARIQSIQAVTAEQTEPVSAYPKFDGNSFVVEPEVYGTAVDMEVLSETIGKYITEFRTELNLMEENCYKLPKYTSDSPEVQAACDTMNEYCKASVTYTMTENVVVDKALISTWLSYDENMKVTFNEDAVREWMRQFGAAYDTVGSTRTITSPSGKTVEVSGGTYGWSVDEDTETQNLINSIKNGETATREPVYAQTAASHSAQDWGSTYLEVDLSAQYMWYIVDGAVALQSDVVTGLPTADRATPAGVYYILYTERNATLKGETDPNTGKPIYETPVSYWMPFTWQGHGFHDATWQPAFGGSLYQSLGSHGCVNMPLDQAANLFNMLSSGTPVVIHY